MSRRNKQARYADRNKARKNFVQVKVWIHVDDREELIEIAQEMRDERKVPKT